MINDNKLIINYLISKIDSFGTPADLNRYLIEYKR